jgi:hypothetical protein
MIYKAELKLIKWSKHVLNRSISTFAATLFRRSSLLLYEMVVRFDSSFRLVLHRKVSSNIFLWSSYAHLGLD